MVPLYIYIYIYIILYYYLAPLVCIKLKYSPKLIKVLFLSMGYNLSDFEQPTLYIHRICDKYIIKIISIYRNLYIFTINKLYIVYIHM